MKSTLSRYTAWQIFIHWITVLLVLTVIILPFMRGIFTSYFGGVGPLFTLHKSFGFILFFITLWRIVVILKLGTPEILAKHQRLQKIASKAVQGLLYILLLLLPLSGFFMSTRPLNLLGLITLTPPNLGENIQAAAHTFHIVGAFTIIGLIALHGLAALYHHFWLKDGVLKAMLPANPNRP